MEALEAAGHRRYYRRRRVSVPDEERRTDTSRSETVFPVKDSARYAGEVSWPRGRRDTVPAAIRGPDCEPGCSKGFRHARESDFLASAAAGRPRVHRSGNTDDAADLWGCCSTSFCDAP